MEGEKVLNAAMIKNRPISTKIITGKKRPHAEAVGSCQNINTEIRISVFVTHS
jgi:hypothetical protein